MNERKEIMVKGHKFFVVADYNAGIYEAFWPYESTVVCQSPSMMGIWWALREYLKSHGL